MTARVLILRTAGTNCDEETAFAFRQAGAEVEKLHVNALRDEPQRLAAFHILALPGGFSYGDDLGAGKVLAGEMLAGLRPALEQFLDAGKLIIGICNGFQVLVKTGLLPGLERWKQQATLTFNDSHKFEDRWVHLKAAETVCSIVESGERVYIPVAHAEGKFVPESEEVLEAMRDAGLIIYRYVDPDGKPGEYPWNPNGAADDIAGICDPTGRIIGLMPHPERHCLPTQHPRWHREGLQEEPDGQAIFQRAVKFVEENLL
jgi:phosphoribosylformylglycinamidine synthase subunit PurQ / glutaminase